MLEDFIKFFKKGRVCKKLEVQKNVTSEIIVSEIKLKQACFTGRPTTSVKPHFCLDLCLLGPNLGKKIFFRGFSSTRY